MESLEIYQQIAVTTGLDADKIPRLPQELLPLLQTLLLQLAEERERRAEAENMLAFFKASANEMPNPIFIKDENLRFVFFNRAYQEFFGLGREEHLGGQVRDLAYLSPEERELYHNAGAKMLETLSTVQYETVFNSPKMGAVESLYWLKGFSVPETDRRGLVSEIVDITKEKNMQKELIRSMRALEVLMKDAKDASNTDPLTKLYNRNIMDEEIPLIISEAESIGQPVCAMLMDIDHFKQINDTYGHPFGDEILRQFAQLLKHTFRQRDVIIRYGGDEFIIFLPGAELSQAKVIAERLLDTVLINLKLPDSSNATISIGIAQWQHEDDISSFLARADNALYLAKRGGRARVVLSD